MSESKNPKEEPSKEESSKEDPSGNQKKEFIRETIEDKKATRRDWCDRALLLLVLAVTFGLIAALTFVLTEPWMQSALRGEEETHESVQIPKDSLETEEEGTDEETTAAPTEDEAALALEEEELRESVEDILDAYLATWEYEEAEEEESIYTELAADMVEALRPAMVTVTTQEASEDIFRQQYVRSEETFGLVLTVTGHSLLILTEPYLLDETEDVTITLGNYSRYDAGVVAMDRTTGIAVVSISLEEMEEEDMEYVEPITLGNSYLCRAGDTVVALGNPMGYVPSVAWGIISYIDLAGLGIDMNFQLIQTDIAGNSQGTGFLVNLKGELVGWITQDYSASESRSVLAAISVSDIKEYIERISNGETMACLGVRVQVVTPALAEENDLPTGLYISDCVSDRAAYEAGLQNGDILVEIDGEPTGNMSEFQNILAACEPGDMVTVTVMRSSRSGYVEQDFQIRLGER